MAAQLERTAQVLKSGIENAAHIEVLIDGFMDQFIGGSQFPVSLLNGVAQVFEGLSRNTVYIFGNPYPLKEQRGEDLIHFSHMDLVGEAEAPDKFPFLTQRLEEEEPVVIILELLIAVRGNPSEPYLQVFAGEDVVQADTEVFHVGKLFNGAGTAFLGSQQELLLFGELTDLCFEGEIGNGSVLLGEIGYPGFFKPGFSKEVIHFLHALTAGTVNTPAVVHFFDQGNKEELGTAHLLETVHLCSGQFTEPGFEVFSLDSQEQGSRNLHFLPVDLLLGGKVNPTVFGDLVKFGQDRQIGIYSIERMITIGSCFFRNMFGVEESALKAGGKSRVHLVQIACDFHKLHFFDGHL